MCQYQAIREEQVVQGRKVSPKPADMVSTLPPDSLPTDTGNQHLLFTPPPTQPESSEVVKRMIVSLSGDGSLPPDTLEHLTPELLTKIEPSLITAAIATRNTDEGVLYKRYSCTTLY